jgi:hypothetical protein
MPPFGCWTFGNPVVPPSKAFGIPTEATKGGRIDKGAIPKVARASRPPARYIQILNHIMPQYLLAVHRPNDYDHSAQLDDVARRDIDMVNELMKSAGVRIFVGGLRPTSLAKSVCPQGDGDVIINEGPYLVTTEYVDGFWVLECADVDEALIWGRKAALACRASVEVRPFH